MSKMTYIHREASEKKVQYKDFLKNSAYLNYELRAPSVKNYFLIYVFYKVNRLPL